MTENSIVFDNKYIFKSDNKFLNNLDLLRKRLIEIPKIPGCYLFKDIEGNILYIGKSKKLRNRIR